MCNWKCPECLSKRPKKDNTNTPIRSAGYVLEAPPDAETEKPSSDVREAYQSDSDQCNEKDDRSMDSNVTTRQKHTFSAPPMIDCAKKDDYITEERFRCLWKNEMRHEFKSMIDASNKCLSNQLKTIVHGL